MKAKELLKTIVYNSMPSEMMGFVWTPVCSGNETERLAKWAEWYSDWFNSKDVCILSENREYLVIVSDEQNFDLYDRIEGAHWALNEYGKRIYLIEVE